MRIKLYTEDMEHYVVFHADELRPRGVLKRVRRERKSTEMAIPTRKTAASRNAVSNFEDATTENLADEYVDIVKDMERIVQIHTDSVIMIKSYKGNATIGLKLNKTDAWDNITAPTLREALCKFQKGEFD